MYSCMSLLLRLDLVEGVDGRVVAAVVEHAQLAQVDQPVVGTDLLGDQLAQLGVAQSQPAALGDAVGLVEEALGIDLIPLLEQIVLENLGVQLCHAVDIGAGIGGKTRHVDGVAVDDAHVSAHVVGDALCEQLFLALVGDQADDVVDLGDDLIHQGSLPFFKRFAEDGVVGVGAGLAGDLKRLVKAHALVHQQTDQLGNAGYGMGIVELDSVFLCKVAEIVAVLCLVAAHDVLQRSGAEEILLL